MTEPTPRVTHWYREPWALFVFSIPLATVVAGLITVWIAVKGADTPVSDPVNRFGMQQEQSR